MTVCTFLVHLSFVLMFLVRCSWYWLVPLALTFLVGYFCISNKLLIVQYLQYNRPIGLWRLGLQ